MSVGAEAGSICCACRYFPVLPGSPSQGQKDMVERPSDKFLSLEKAYELEHKTGFSRKELLTFHKHYGACIDSLGRITEEDKQAFLKEMDLENDEVTLQVMDSIQAIERKKPGKASKQKKRN